MSTKEKADTEQTGASQYYHGPGYEDYNCAQAVLKHFQQRLDIPQAKIDAFAAAGGGNAEGGLCGALYAAMTLMDDPQRAAELRRRFRSEFRGETCEQIKQPEQKTCPHYVDRAATLAEDMLAEDDALQNRD